VLKQLIWVGAARADLKSLPTDVQDEFGYGLYQAQLVCFLKAAKPLLDSMVL